MSALVLVAVGVVVVAGRVTGVVGVVRLRGGVVDTGLFAGFVAGLVAGFVEGRLVLPPIIPPPVTPPGSCCASATLLLVVNNRTADRQSERGEWKDMTFSPAIETRMNGERRAGHYS